MQIEKAKNVEVVVAVAAAAAGQEHLSCLLPSL